MAQSLVFYVIVIHYVSEESKGGLQPPMDILIHPNDSKEEAELIICQRVVQFYEAKGVIAIWYDVTKETASDAWEEIREYENYRAEPGDAMAQYTCSRKEIFLTCQTA